MMILEGKICKKQKINIKNSAVQIFLGSSFSSLLGFLMHCESSSILLSLSKNRGRVPSVNLIRLTAKTGLIP